MPVMAIVETRFGRIGYSRGERGSGTPMVFLHGVGSDKGVWHPQLESTPNGRHCVAFDYPGYGESEFVPGASRDEFAASILAGMTELGIERAHICGLSLGGVIAIAIHAQAAERCASLILADSFAIHPDGQAIYERSIVASGQLGMRGLAEARVSTLLGREAAEVVRAEVVETMSRIDPKAYALGADAVWLADQRHRAATIAAPTLVLCGDEDTITPPTLSEELAALIDGASLQIIAGSGHLTNLEQPDQFNGAVSHFLANNE